MIAQYANPPSDIRHGSEGSYQLQDERHHYIHWPRERFCWYKTERAESVGFVT